MNDSFLNEFDEAVADLREHLNGFVFGYALSFVHDALEIATVAVLLNDVEVVVAFHHLQETNDVWRLQTFQDVDLREERVLYVGVAVDCANSMGYSSHAEWL